MTEKCPECGGETNHHETRMDECEDCGWQHVEVFDAAKPDPAALAEKVAKAVIKHQMRMSSSGEAPTSWEILAAIIRRVIKEGT